MLFYCFKSKFPILQKCKFKNNLLFYTVDGRFPAKIPANFLIWPGPGLKCYPAPDRGPAAGIPATKSRPICKVWPGPG